MNAFIVVGIDKWEEFTLPAIKSIKAHHPDDLIIVVDACSEEPYPRTELATVLRLDRSPSYAFAINQGILLAKPSKPEFFCVLNNDIRMDKPINFKDLDDGHIYSRQIITEDGHTWMGLWIAVFHRRVYDTVGPFDPMFLYCGFEDADWCIRGAQFGIPTVHYPFPVTHYWGKTRWGLKGYAEVREDNINYFQSKHGFRLGANMKVTHD